MGLTFGRRLYSQAERYRMALGSMANGTIGGDSKIGMPITILERQPLVAEEEHLAFGAFDDGVAAGSGVDVGGTVEQSYAGVFQDTGPIVLVPPAAFNAGGTVNYHFTVGVGSVNTQGAVWVQMTEQGTNFVLARIDPFASHSLNGSTPGTTVFSGSFDFPTAALTMGYEAVNNVRLGIERSGLGSGNTFNCADSYWEMVFP